MPSKNNLQKFQFVNPTCHDLGPLLLSFYVPLPIATFYYNYNLPVSKLNIYLKKSKYLQILVVFYLCPKQIICLQQFQLATQISLSILIHFNKNAYQ